MKKELTYAQWLEVAAHLRTASEALSKAFMILSNSGGHSKPEPRMILRVEKQLDRTRNELDSAFLRRFGTEDVPSGVRGGEFPFYGGVPVPRNEGPLEWLCAEIEARGKASRNLAQAVG